MMRIFVTSCRFHLVPHKQLLTVPLQYKKYMWAECKQKFSTMYLGKSNSSAARVNILNVTVRSYKNFGHRDVRYPKFIELFVILPVICFCGATFNIPYIVEKLEDGIQDTFRNDEEEEDEEEVERNESTKSFLLNIVSQLKSLFKVDAASLEQVASEQNVLEKNQDDALIPTEKQKKGKQKIGFRERKIIEYENRIRVFSSPEKVFRYFATLKVLPESSEGAAIIYMTPDDLIRAITPNLKQPDGLGLDQYIKYDPKNMHMRLELALDEDSIFFKLGSSGLISFSDYIFLLTLLSTSRRHFEIAFRMFDLNGDGNVDCDEFEKVATLIRQQTSIGSRHRDHTITGSTFKGVNSALTTYFFGENLDKKLTIEKFLEFQQQLQREILTLEFQRKDPDENGKITEVDFTDLLLAYAGYTPKKKSKMIKRVKKAFKENSQGISLDDYLKFFHFLNNINDVDTALTFYNIASASIDQATLKHVAKTVAHINLNDHVVEVVFTIFDENLDGQLSNKEFIAVMKNRLLRGLEKPKDTGFIKFVQAITKCAKEEVFSWYL